MRVEHTYVPHSAGQSGCARWSEVPDAPAAPPAPATRPSLAGEESPVHARTNAVGATGPSLLSSRASRESSVRPREPISVLIASGRVHGRTARWGGDHVSGLNLDAALQAHVELWVGDLTVP